MNISIFGAELWEEKLFKQSFKNHKIQFLEGALSDKNAAAVKNADIVSVFVTSPVTKNLIQKIPRLKMIATRSTGFDHIDREECKKRKIVVSNVPAYGDNTVAEHAFALMLGVARKLVPTVERTRRGNFSLDNLQGIDLKGKTLGVVGTGKIGKNVIRIAQGFQMNILAFDLFPDKNYAKQMGFTYVPLDKILHESDIITLHIPATKDTVHLINNKNIQQIKKGAILINTSRGAVVETHALVTALKRGILSGAGLDVLEEEGELIEEAELLISNNARKLDVQTLLEEHVLIDMDNVLITPHNAFNTIEAVHRITQTTIENIHSFLNGKPMNVVN